ncbi:hypothetical protein GCM10023092_15070 [Rurimicrobium arvi]|uniref:Apea-like HEPN domain-containing protein n=2 Tax=Rurimicrobium arvi TaxID=2049916 RepID=A0ABP8MRQ0_9BACT
MGALYTDNAPEVCIVQVEHLLSFKFDEKKFYKDLHNCSHFFTEVFDLMWLERDHSISLKAGFKFLVDEKGHYSKPIFSAQTSSEVSTLLDGSLNITAFSEQEILSAVSRLEKIEKAHPEVKDIDPTFTTLHKTRSYSSALLNEADYKTFTKIDIIRLFLRMYRSTPVMIQKIAFAGPIFDCLFGCSETGEITYKISMRIAKYIGGTNEEQEETFNTVSDIYNIRSRFLHGGIVKPKGETTIKELAEKCDKLLRRIYIKVLDNDMEMFIKTKDEKLKDHFNSLVWIN